MLAGKRAQILKADEDPNVGAGLLAKAVYQIQMY